MLIYLRTLLYLFFALLLVNCGIGGMCKEGDKKCAFPATHYMELVDHGVTLRVNNLRSGITESNTYPSIVISGELFMLPSVSQWDSFHEMASDPEFWGLRDYFRIKFVIENSDGTFTTIEEDTSGGSDPYYSDFIYYVNDPFVYHFWRNPQFDPWDFQLYYHSGVAYIPIDSTHVELWERRSVDEEFVRSRHVALDSLSDYRNIVKPYIEANR